MATTHNSLTVESKAKWGAIGGGTGAVIFLLAPVAATYFMIDDKDMMTTGIAVAISVGTVPISLIHAPVAAPVGAVWLGRDMIEELCYTGDLSVPRE